MAEPTTDLERFARKYCRELILVGNIDSRILLFGDKQAIEKEAEITSCAPPSPLMVEVMMEERRWLQA